MNNIFIYLVLIFIIFFLFDIKKSINEIKNNNLNEDGKETKLTSSDYLNIGYLLKELAIITQNIKLKIDIGAPTWKKEYPHYLEYGNHMIKFDGNWFYHLVLESINPRIQSALHSVGDKLNKKADITFTFKKQNDRKKINYLIIGFGYISFLIIEEKVESDDNNWDKFEGLCNTNLTEYSIDFDDGNSDFDYDGKRETLIMKKGFIQKIYDFSIKQQHITVELEDK